MPRAEVRVPTQPSAPKGMRRQKKLLSERANVAVFGFPNIELDRVSLLKPLLDHAAWQTGDFKGKDSKEANVSGRDACDFEGGTTRNASIEAGGRSGPRACGEQGGQSADHKAVPEPRRGLPSRCPMDRH